MQLNSSVGVQTFEVVEHAVDAGTEAAITAVVGTGRVVVDFVAPLVPHGDQSPGAIDILGEFRIKAVGTRVRT